MLHCTSLYIERYLGDLLVAARRGDQLAQRLPAGARVGVHDSGIVESDGPSTLDAHFRIARN
jgi:hypothetical protein